jgi:hypothetical protein
METAKLELERKKFIKEHIIAMDQTSIASLLLTNIS